MDESTIVLIILGALLLFIFIIWCYCRSWRKKRQRKHERRLLAEWDTEDENDQLSLSTPETDAKRAQMRARYGVGETHA